MHPAHYKPRYSHKSNGVYVCTIVSLAACLVLTYGYWRRAAGTTSELNRKLQEEAQKTKQQYLEQSELLRSKIEETERLEREKGSLEERVGRLEQEKTQTALRVEALERRAEKAEKLNIVMDEKKAAAESKYEVCKGEVTSLKNDLGTEREHAEKLSKDLEAEKKSLEDAQTRRKETENTKTEDSRPTDVSVTDKKETAVKAHTNKTETKTEVEEQTEVVVGATDGAEVTATEEGTSTDNRNDTTTEDISRSETVETLQDSVQKIGRSGVEMTTESEDKNESSRGTEPDVKADTLSEAVAMEASQT